MILLPKDIMRQREVAWARHASFGLQYIDQTLRTVNIPSIWDIVLNHIRTFRIDAKLSANGCFSYNPHAKFLELMPVVGPFTLAASMHEIGHHDYIRILGYPEWIQRQLKAALSGDNTIHEEEELAWEWAKKNIPSNMWTREVNDFKEVCLSTYEPGYTPEKYPERAKVIFTWIENELNEHLNIFVRG